MIVADINKLDGVEIRPGVILIGNPAYNEEAKEWRCLANVNGMLALISLQITVLPE